MNSKTVENLIGDISQLEDGSLGLRFDLKYKDETIPAFAVRYEGQIYAYLNRCGHIAVQLDFPLGDFFGDDGQTLMCATHGAEYAPDTGRCLGGPCNGVGLEMLEVKEDRGQLYLLTNDYEVVSNHV